VLVAVLLIPVGVVVYLSFTNSSLDSTGPLRNVGLANYKLDVFSGTFASALWVTSLITMLSVIIQFPIGYALAEALHRQLRGTKIFQSILLVPMLLTPVAVGLMWRLLFDPDLGAVTWLISLVTRGPNPNFLGSQALAVGALLFVNAWMNIPFIMIMFLAGLQGLPQEPMEAALMDGSTPLQTMIYIKLPLLAPVIWVIFLIRVITDWKLFDIVYSLTQGGPGASTQTVSFLNYQLGFNFFLTGQAAATAVAIAVLAMPLYFAFSRVMSSRL
jgi:multiple sugar transport system permease protein